MGEEDKAGEHFREGRKHLEKGTQKVLEEGIRRGKEQREKLEYYSQNRSELVENFSRRIGNPKKPATSGTIVLVPLLAVLLVVTWLFGKIEQIPGNRYFNISQLFELGNTASYYLNQSFKLAVLLVLAAVLVTGVGRFVRTGRGFQMEKLLDRIFDRIPFLGSVYNITKVTTETVLGGAEDFSKPVKVEFNGFRVTGFKTGNEADDGRQIVFIPTAPNITSGLVVEIEEEKIIESDESAEEALTRTLSAGFGQSKEKVEDKD